MKEQIIGERKSMGKKGKKSSARSASPHRMSSLKIYIVNIKKKLYHISNIEFLSSPLLQKILGGG